MIKNQNKMLPRKNNPIVKVNTKALLKYYKNTTPTITFKNLKKLADVGVPLRAVCIPQHDDNQKYEIHINPIREEGFDAKDLVLTKNRDKQKKLMKSETICRVFLQELGFESIEFAAK